MKSELLYKSNDDIGEAATWLSDSNTLLWVDIPNGVVHFYNVSKKEFSEIRLPEIVSSVIPIKNNSNEVLLTMQNKLVRFDLKKKTFIKVIDFKNSPEIRANDSKASPEGRLWIGMLHQKDHNNTGSLWRVDSNLSLNKILIKQQIPNGIVWNKIGDKMYYADSGRGCIEEYTYDPISGNISNLRIAIQIPAALGVPDGMTIDSKGNLWVAHWGGFGVYIWDPITGNLLNKIKIPVPNIASCTFGGEKNEKLYITTARSGLTSDELSKYPLSGSLFCADTGIAGGKNHFPFVFSS